MTTVYLKHRRDPIIVKEAPLALARRLFQAVRPINVTCVDGRTYALHPDAIRDLPEGP